MATESWPTSPWCVFDHRRTAADGVGLTVPRQHVDTGVTTMSEDRMGQAVSSTVGSMQQQMSGAGGEKGTSEIADPGRVASLLETWPDKPREVADKMTQQYGPPNEATQTRLLWHGNGPWKRTIVYRDEVPHNFPKPHTDLLEQFVDYRVPLDRFNDLAAFDGSVIPERTKGEISARCDMEPMNFLALNLAHDVATGNLTVEQARRRYAEIATSFMSGANPAETQRLAFEPTTDTADADKPLMGPMVGQMAGQLTGE